jgi:hypothetical protein
VRNYDAIVFDLLTALIDSWTIWNRAAGSAEDGLRWRREYLALTYAAGPYRRAFIDLNPIVSSVATSRFMAVATLSFGVIFKVRFSTLHPTYSVPLIPLLNINLMYLRTAR